MQATATACFYIHALSKTRPECYGKRVLQRKEAILEYQTIKGEKVPSLGLGTWRLSRQECVRSVERALDLGYRHIDTAQIYANEDEIGRGIQTSGVDREEINGLSRPFILM